MAGSRTRPRAGRVGAPALAANPLPLASLAPEAALARLGSRRDGLGAAEAADRLVRWGPNLLPRPHGRRRLHLMLRNLTHLLALLLWAAAGLALIAGLPALTGAIVAVVLVNAVVAFVQEDHADRLLRALTEQLPSVAQVRRDGVVRAVAVRDLVPGDVVLLRAGDRVPADARVITAEALEVDHSSLTGESEPLPRSAAAVVAAAPLDAANLLFAGTIVLAGEAEAAVHATGAATEMAAIAGAAQALRPVRSPLERQIDRVARTTAVVAVGVGLGVLLLALALDHRSTEDALVFAVGVIVALTPEGLLPTVSLGLALGATRIARRQGLVRRLSAVEALGSATVICTDKTGTLTEGRLAPQRFWTPDLTVAAPFPGSGAGFQRLAEHAHAASEAEARDGAAVRDPIDTALMQLATLPQQPSAPLLRVFPFDLELRRTTLVRAAASGASLAACKGAPESVLPLLAPGEPAEWAAAVTEAMAADGLRVIAVATRELAGDGAHLPREMIERDLVLAGLVGFLDPPRDGVPEAVARCERAGIRIHVMSGDHAATARAVAERVGLRPTSVVTGAQLDLMPDAHLRDLLRGSGVFARATPQHKLRIVEALRAMGEVVAVTGDGVNDAPALRRADVGVAMGRRGTEAARQAADIVLLDDNFASVVAAVEEGRAIFGNIRKFATYVFTSNVAELVPFLAFILFDIPLAIPVLLVLAIDLGTDLLPAVALAAEPPEEDLMARPPRPPAEPILTPSVLLRALLFLGLIEAALGMAFFFGRFALDGWIPGDSLPDSGPLYESAKAAAFLGIVGGQVGALLACRSGRLASLGLPRLRGRWLLIGLGWEAAIAAAVAFLPPVSAAFDVRSPGIMALFVPAAALTLLLLDDLRKGVASALTRQPRSTPVATAPR